MEEQRKELTAETAFFVVGIILAAIAIVIAALFALFPEAFALLRFPCIFHEITGLYCPGCGGTRAVKALLGGHIITSFMYNPIVIYSVVMYIWFMVSQLLERLTKGKVKGLRYRHLYLWLALFIVVINCIVRNVLMVRYGITLFIYIT